MFRSGTKSYFTGFSPSTAGKKGISCAHFCSFSFLRGLWWFWLIHLIDWLYRVQFHWTAFAYEALNSLSLSWKECFVQLFLPNRVISFSLNFFSSVYGLWKNLTNTSRVQLLLRLNNFFDKLGSIFSIPKGRPSYFWLFFVFLQCPILWYLFSMVIRKKLIFFAWNWQWKWEKYGHEQENGYFRCSIFRSSMFMRSVRTRKWWVKKRTLVGNWICDAEHEHNGYHVLIIPLFCNIPNLNWNTSGS